MITVQVWLYGPLAQYAGQASQGSHAQLTLELEKGSTVADLIQRLGIPAEERGITFINGNLAALPGLDADRDVVLHDGDRVGIFHLRSMWPFQYRFGAHMTPELKEAFSERPDRGVRHAYVTPRKT